MDFPLAFNKASHPTPFFIENRKLKPSQMIPKFSDSSNSHMIMWHFFKFLYIIAAIFLDHFIDFLYFIRLIVIKCFLPGVNWLNRLTCLLLLPNHYCSSSQIDSICSVRNLLAGCNFPLLSYFLKVDNFFSLCCHL